ncbi:MAG: NAD-glutamate dehydrogenase [Candidatus Paracaedibacteraceae bacterium]|nr:NAD-glutamate dehydrogenase [Candidatus Paracaedibacteraceae bacterium]
MSAILKVNTMFNEFRLEKTQLLVQHFSQTKHSIPSLFIEKFMERFPSSYLEKLSQQDLEKYIQLAWKALSQFDRKTPKIDIHIEKISLHRTDRIFITLVNIDRPYLIESLLAFFQKWNLKPQLLVHPVINVKRDNKGALQTLEGHQKKSDNSCVFESLVFVQARNRYSKDQIVHLKNELNDLLDQVCTTVDDITPILDRLNSIRDRLPYAAISHSTVEEAIEAKEFLSWLSERYFIPIGGRYFHLKEEKTTKMFCLEEDESERLGLFKIDDYAGSDDMVPSLSRAINRKDLVKQRNNAGLITVIKSNKRSPIHRPSRMDTMEILDCDETGKVCGMYQIIGIFTKEIFSIHAFEIPYLRKKVQTVFDLFKLNPKWYDGKSLLSIIDSIPRDEMFYHTAEQLFQICDNVMELRDHAGLSVFTRPDIYGRYMTVMVFMTRERYSYALKEKLGSIIATYFDGQVGSSVAQIGDLPFARVIYAVEFKEITSKFPSTKKLQQILADESLGWFEQLERYLDTHTIVENTSEFLALYRHSFPLNYQQNFAAPEVFEDIGYLNDLNSNTPIDINIYTNAEGKLRLKIYHEGEALSLSTLLPLLNNFGLKVQSETTYTIHKNNLQYHIHDFAIDIDAETDWRTNEIYLQTAFQTVWSGAIDNDGFNQLILKAGLTIRQTNMIRAYAKYLLQARLPYSQHYIEQTLSAYPSFCRDLVEIFERKFNPDLDSKTTLDTLEATFLDNLQKISRLDHDKILRRILNTIQSTVRTNYYQQTPDQQNKDYLSFKLDSGQLMDLPQPRPMFEIFVYSSTMEAIHLRGGKVARGGLRWSDRFEDYRTEVLGLMKAQMVKNSVIVPLGSKGGFIVKRQNHFTDRTELMNEVVRCYQTMIRGMLDITDNLVQGQVVPPPQVIRYDGNDPYLVVAADKGTASFSDIANAISLDYGFWLDDAFASGGSAGYDHKKMAITSRGAWESVKRHFREMGINVQTQPFTVAGVGDMSGDVFGNGMLRSQQIRLIAAFDHRHIFLDPNPDPAISHAERKRLFELPRSSWDDYNKDLISTGGGVFSRSEKSIKLSDEIQKSLGLNQKMITPDELMRAILQAEVDLLWFGGIGTYIKSKHESNADVGDVTNATIRIDGGQIRARVVGEGANLGMTQLGRVDYAIRGGRLNTDAIDNSAGVDCSDHEVNIKILFSSMKKPLNREKRNEILVEMTQTVADLVLKDNYQQTQILSVMHAAGKDGLSQYQNLIKILENEIHLNRALEYLPDDEIFERRRSKDQGMTRPELAILLAYSKISLYNKIMESTLADQDFYLENLIGYFPDLMQKKFKEDILNHPLRREIIATVLANTLINRVGPNFVYEMIQATNCSASEVVHAFFVAVRSLGLEAWWRDIDSLDDILRTDLQIQAYADIAFSLKIAVMRILGSEFDDTEHANGMIKTLPTLIAGEDQQNLAQNITDLLGQNIPAPVAEKISLIKFLSSILDIVSLYPEQYDLDDVAKVYFEARSLFGLDWLQDTAMAFDAESDWQESAQLGLLDDIGQTIMAVTQQIINAGYVDTYDEWALNQEPQVRLSKQTLAQVRSASRPDLAMMGFAIRQIQRMPNFR